MTSIYYIYIKIIKPYITLENIISSSPCKQTLLYKEKIFLQLFADSILYSFKNKKNDNILTSIKSSDDSKFDIFYKYLNNTFISQEQKNELNSSFYLCQKYYRIFCKLAYLYKFKRAKKYEFDTDLCFTPLDTISDKCKIKLYDNQTNTIYNFRISDLIKIINDALSYSPDFFTTPLYIKNPFTNINFTNAQLYNIYFKIKESNYLMPILFYLYFLENFNLYLFSINNESIIRDYYIENYSKSFDNETKLEIIDEMFTFFFKITNNNYLSILNQPNDILLDLFEKIIPDYLYAIYSLNPDVRKYKSKKVVNYIKRIKTIIDSNFMFSNTSEQTTNQSGFRFVYNN